jgi:hypothetical protein
MRHAAHCKLYALLDHGFHDITTCITLPSTSLAQHPIGDLTDISTTLRITLGFSICRQLPKGFRCLSTWKPLHQTPYLSRSLLSPSRCNRDRREIGLMKTAISHEFVQNSSIHVTKSSPGLPFCLPFPLPHLLLPFFFSGCTLKKPRRSQLRMRKLSESGVLALGRLLPFCHLNTLACSFFSLYPLGID